MMMVKKWNKTNKPHTHTDRQLWNEKKEKKSDMNNHYSYTCYANTHTYIDRQLKFFFQKKNYITLHIKQSIKHTWKERKNERNYKMYNHERLLMKNGLDICNGGKKRLCEWMNPESFDEQFFFGLFFRMIHHIIIIIIIKVGETNK